MLKVASAMPDRVSLAAILTAVTIGLPIAAVSAQSLPPVREVAKLLAPDGGGEDVFGTSVSISGDTVIIGSPDDDDRGWACGTAHIFARNADGTWARLIKLVAEDGADLDQFGYSVSISGGAAIVGAYRDDDRGTDSGSVYFYRRDATGSWSAPPIKVLAGDGSAGAGFGCSVAISGDRAVVGAFLDDSRGTDSGSAYVFRRESGGAWTQTAKIIPADPAAGQRFGASVAIDGDLIIVGAVHDATRGPQSGAAYIFRRDALEGWNQTAKLLPADGAPGDLFGASVAISGESAVVGAYLDDDLGTDSGSAYVFRRDAAGPWVQSAKLLADDGQAVDCFGGSVALSGDTAVVGAWGADARAINAGAAYVYRRGGAGTWGQIGKLLVGDAEPIDLFGRSLALDGGTAVIGTPYDDDRGGLSGSAYIFGPHCPADCDDSGRVDMLDFACFQGAFALGDLPRADCTGDGRLDLRDFVCFQNTFVAGCR